MAKKFKGGLEKYGAERFSRFFGTIRKSMGLKGLNEFQDL